MNMEMDGDAGASARPIADSIALQSLLIGCRLDLETVRRDVACDEDVSSSNAITRLERRLRRVADRLERAAGAIDSKLEDAAPPAYKTASAAIMLRESDHRVRNSLQSVMMLLENQARQTKSEETRAALQVAVVRVDAVAQVHAALNHSGGVAPELDLGSYLKQLGGTLERALCPPGSALRLRLDVAPLSVCPEDARCLGLIVAELATNAFHHAFNPGQKGTVSVTGTRGPAGYTLSIEDDGRGLPRGFDMRQRPTGLGLRMVNTLADQLRVRLIADSPRGARFTLVLPRQSAAQ